MTYEEAKNLKSFAYRCNCGGFAYAMNGRKSEDPHATWCPQREEYLQWYKAINKKENP